MLYYLQWQDNHTAATHSVYVKAADLGYYLEGVVATNSITIEEACFIDVWQPGE